MGRWFRVECLPKNFKHPIVCPRCCEARPVTPGGLGTLFALHIHLDFIFQDSSSSKPSSLPAVSYLWGISIYQSFFIYVLLFIYLYFTAQATAQKERQKKPTVFLFHLFCLLFHVFFLTLVHAKSVKVCVESRSPATVPLLMPPRICGLNKSLG